MSEVQIGHRYTILAPASLYRVFHDLRTLLQEVIC